MSVRNDRVYGSPNDAGSGTPSANDAGGSGSRTLDAKSQSTIEDRLRTMYDRVAEEPVPDRFLDLLDKLGRAEGSSEGGAA